MNSTKTFIAMALVTSLAMQPIAAQPVEQTAKRQSKIVKQLEDSYKNLAQHLKCAVKGDDCTPEEKKRIRRTALAIIGTLIAAYLVKRALPEDPQSLRVRAAPRKWYKPWKRKLTP